MKLIHNSRKPAGQHSHITDALGYVLFWLEPRAKIKSVPSSKGVAPISIPQTGPKIF
jgi:hypothetical protein